MKTQELLLDANIECPECTWHLFREEHGKRDKLLCENQNCGLYGVRYKVPTVTLEVVES